MLGTKLWECGFFVGSWICRCSIGTGISEPRIPRGLLGVFSRVATPRLGVERGRQASSPPILAVGMWSIFSGVCASWRIISGGGKKDEAICKSWSFGFQISHVSPPPTDLLQQHQPGDIIFANPDHPGRIHALHKVQGGPRCHNPSQDHVLITPPTHTPFLPRVSLCRVGPLPSAGRLWFPLSSPVLQHGLAGTNRADDAQNRIYVGAPARTFCFSPFFPFLPFRTRIIDSNSIRTTTPTNPPK